MHRSLPSRLWFRGRYYLSGLILILPLVAFPNYFKMVGAPPLGANILPERSVGPFRVTLAEFMRGPPRPGPRNVPLKDMRCMWKAAIPTASARSI